MNISYSRKPSMKKLLVVSLLLVSCSVFNLCKAQYSVLHNFSSATVDGQWPFGNLTLAGGKLYGMTFYGGRSGVGDVFSIDTGGTNFKDLWDFSGNNGNEPHGSLLLLGGVLYGMADNIFAIDTDGNNYTILHNFNFTTGYQPYGSLTLLGNILYGMTPSGGVDSDGVIFSIHADGTNYKDIFDFNGVNGSKPHGDLTIVGNKLYGMTEFGGTNNIGCIFSIDTDGGGYRDLIDFNNTNGTSPYGSLTLSGSILYGMTEGGGAHNEGCLFSVDTNGSNYKEVYSFLTPAPLGSVNVIGDVIYGMEGSASHIHGITYGNIFTMDTNGSGFQQLYLFDSASGFAPQGSLTVSGNMLYGMTNKGGTNGFGVIFGFKGIETPVHEVKAPTNSLSVYPNPSNGIFTVSFSHAVRQLADQASQTIVEIYNVFGQKVNVATLKQAQGDYAINMNGQPSGLYFLKATTSDGETLTQKVSIIR